MTNDERGMLKDIICFGTKCCDCVFSDGCNWKEAADKTLIFYAKKAIEKANSENKKTLLDYAKNTGAMKYLTFKAQII